MQVYVRVVSVEIKRRYIAKLKTKQNTSMTEHNEALDYIDGHKYPKSQEKMSSLAS